MENNQQTQNQNNSDNKKVAKQFETNMKKLVAIVQGEANLKPIKVQQNAMAELVEELFKDERKEAADKVKTGLRNLLKGHVDFTRAVKAKEQELEKLKTDKMKEFNKTASDLFGQISGLDQLVAEYQNAGDAAMNAVGNPANEEEENDDEEQNK